MSRVVRQGEFVFEVNPLVLQIVLWNEAEILNDKSDFLALSHVNRVAEICKQLYFASVAEVNLRSIPEWVPTDEIERDCGGSNIIASLRYELAVAISNEERRDIAKMINRQFRRRLKFIVKECVLEFETYNFGLSEIDGLDSSGRLRWRADDARSSRPLKLAKAYN